MGRGSQLNRHRSHEPPPVGPGCRGPVVDGAPHEVANVVWATGFRQVFDRIHLPVLDDDGWPREMRGVAAEAEGLFFCGLSFQYAFSSMLLAGAGRGADLAADRLTARIRQAARLSAAA